MLRLVKLPLFEEDQPEVGVENENVRILERQPAIDDLGLGEGVGLEVHQSEEIEHIGVVRAKPLRILQLAPCLSVPGLLKRFTSAVVMEEEDALVERRGYDRVSFGHNRGGLYSGGQSWRPARPAALVAQGSATISTDCSVVPAGYRLPR